VGVLVKQLSATERPEAIIFYFGVLSSLLALPPALAVWQPLDAVSLAALCVIGVVGTTGQYFVIRAYRLVEATQIEPIDYIKLLIATAIGFVGFGEWPDVWVFVGAGIIIAATLYITRREARLRAPGRKHRADYWRDRGAGQGRVATHVRRARLGRAGPAFCRLFRQEKRHGREGSGSGGDGRRLRAGARPRARWRRRAPRWRCSTCARRRRRPCAREIGGIALACDVADAASGEQAMAAAAAQHGAPRVLVNCAGVGTAHRIVGKEGRCRSPTSPR
jgi:uncharacterized membrane protein